MGAFPGRGASAVRIRFFHGDKPRERVFRECFEAGLQAHGDELEARKIGEECIVSDADVAVMFGVKSRELWRAHARAGVRVVLIDKGYTRQSLPGVTHGWIYWRVSIGAHQPTHYLMSQNLSDDRALRVGWRLRPWRREGKHILLAGSSQKYHEFVELSGATDWVTKIVKRAGKLTDREIVYRPKPSWLDAEPVDGAIFQTDKTPPSEALKGAWATIVHGSSICVESVCQGVPVIVLGDAVARPISSTTLEEIEYPRLASDAERWQWLSNLAYQQWTLREFSSGEAWNYLRPLVYGTH